MSCRFSFVVKLHDGSVYTFAVHPCYSPLTHDNNFSNKFTCRPKDKTDELAYERTVFYQHDDITDRWRDERTGVLQSMQWIGIPLIHHKKALPQELQEQVIQYLTLLIPDDETFKGITVCPVQEWVQTKRKAYLIKVPVQSRVSFNMSYTLLALRHLVDSLIPGQLEYSFDLFEKLSPQADDKAMLLVSCLSCHRRSYDHTWYGSLEEFEAHRFLVNSKIELSPINDVKFALVRLVQYRTYYTPSFVNYLNQFEGFSE